MSDLNFITAAVLVSLPGALKFTAQKLSTVLFLPFFLSKLLLTKSLETRPGGFFLFKQIVKQANSTD